MSRLASLLAAGILAGCAQDDRMVGNGSETTTGITARVLGRDGQPVAGASVQLRPSNWIPDTSATEDPARQFLTDSDGLVRVPALPSGSWTIFAIGPDGRAMSHLERGEIPARLDLELSLSSSASLRGHVATTNGSRSWIAVAGLPGSVRPDASGDFLLEGLPAGDHVVQVLAVGDSVRRCAKILSIGSGAIQDAGTLVPRSRATFESLTDSVIAEFDLGPARTDTLFSYPLLLRLTDTSLDFSKTRGTDLSITRGGRAMAHQVERWNALDRIAEIWVRMDTLLPDQPKLSLTVHYGGADRADWSSSSSVFPAADGWAAVWHLAADDPGAEATHRHRAVDWRTLDAPGAVGRGRFCDTGWLRIPDAVDLRVQDLTLSCWAKRKGSQIATGKLFSKGNLGDWRNTWALQEFDRTSRVGFLSVRTDSVPDTLRSTTALPDGNWSLVTATWDSRTGRQRLFIDGAPVDSTTQLRRFDYANRPPIDMELFLGANFIGTIDEARLSRIPRSADWIALDHRTQKPDAGIVRFLKQP